MGFSIDGKGYVVWGYESENGQKDASVLQFDPTDGTGGSWTSLTTIPNIVYNVVIDGLPGIPLVLDNKAYITGGILSTETWEFDPQNDGWTKMGNVVVNPLSGFKIGDRGYLIGARDECLQNNNPSCQNWKNVILSYDNVANDSTEVAEIPSEVSTASGRVFSGTPCQFSALVGNSESGENYKIDFTDAVTINGSKELCTLGTDTYTLVNGPSNMDINWTTSSNIQIESGQGSNEVEVYQSGWNGTGWIRADIQDACGTYQFEKTNIKVGSPEIQQYPFKLHVGENLISGTSLQYNVYNLVIITCNDSGCTEGMGNFNWEITATNSYVSHVDGHNSALIKPNGANVTVSFWAFNECGNSETKYQQMFQMDGFHEGNPGAPSIPGDISKDDPVMIPITPLETITGGEVGFQSVNGND